MLKSSLRVSFDHHVGGQRWNSLSRMVLNNSNNDPSYINQCLGYGMFRRAGLAAPRCSFAHVRINDEDLGSCDRLVVVERGMPLPDERIRVCDGRAWY